MFAKKQGSMWHARFADTFDDVISTSVATGALASGTPSPALCGDVVV